MATYEIPPGHIGVHVKQLAPNVVDTVVFRLGDSGTPGWGGTPKKVEIITDGGADIYVTFGADQTPTIGGSHCWRVPGLAGATTLTPLFVSRGDMVIKLISGGSPTYSVARS